MSCSNSSKIFVSYLKSHARKIVTLSNPNHGQKIYYSTNNDQYIVKSPLPDVAEGDGVTITEAVWSLVGNWGDAIAYECSVSGYKLTHNQVFRHSRSFAASLLQSTHLKRGDTVCVALPNIPQYAPILYGIWDAGMVACPVNPEYTQYELQRQIQNSESKFVITSPALLPGIQSIPDIKSIVVVGNDSDPKPEKCHSYADMIQTDPIGFSFLKGSDINTREQVAILPYSSGTTGLPKGVMLTHANLANHILQLTQPDAFKFYKFGAGDPQDKFVGLLPFFHCYGMTSFLIVGHAIGAHVMCVPKFNPAEFVKVVRMHKPTKLHLVTPLISYIAASPAFGKQELESVYAVVAGAAPIGSSLIERFHEKAQKEILFQESYGMTELSPGATVLPAHFGRTKTGSCGVPLSNTFLKVLSIDDADKILGPGEPGELCFKGPQVMKGYWKNEQATRDTIRQGWLHTGDVGYYDKDSCVYIVDRIKELIKVKGYQVAPAELEEVLRTHPCVEDAGVIGVKVDHDEMTEWPRAYVVLKPGQSPTERDVMDFVKARVAVFKQLKGGVQFVKEIPKAPSGKILRRELLKRYHGDKK